MSKHSMFQLQVETAQGPFNRVERPIPTPAKGEVLVRIAASGVNPLDAKIRAGAAAHARHPFPAVLGLDMAGEVVALGAGVSGFAVGDRVYGLTGGVGGIPGSLAQYAAVDARLLARAPASLSLREAAAMPLVVITAWEGLVDRARVSAGQKVLVQGGAGGVGQVAIQLARAFGAEAFATGRAGQAAFIEGLGATAIDFEKIPVEEMVARHTDSEGFDIVYNSIGGPALDDAFQAVRTYSGQVVSSLGWGSHSLAPLSFRGASYSGVFTLLPLLSGKGREHHGQILAQAARLVDAGLLKVHLDPRRFNLDQAEEAHLLLTGGQAQGKLVVDIL
ncbi:zinc-dependent alcohol dehydrogenase family protein [Gallaecimonas kandeliae]|uniref:zinc-dependent alcohol dehydrogenase family protein n=1 Tax=Gallaecimonas kandeliae TaxID=3029055 RepID=UPI002647C2CB|nr:zinc-dependent alcohol dehydrogenase family protein [Gallaecimonas kandeliae]WKE66493.1 zinc-dependent alcohol dehydrogenase family protein [Gallaecimonas kandeliae]